MAEERNKMSLEHRFKKAAHFVAKSPANPDISNADKLETYSLYKQATVGDVQGSQPWAVQLEARAKWYRNQKPENKKKRCYIIVMIRDSGMPGTLSRE